MKKTKSCPKCGCTKLLQDKESGDQRLILGWFKAVPITRHVCTDCGYAESWLDEKHLPDLKKRFEKERSKS